MAKTCPGCGAPMEYDPSFDSLVCTTCGNIVDPQTLPDARDVDNESRDEGPVDIKDTLSEEEELPRELYDCHIYRCSQCGGEVIVTGTEISTRCVYCGSTAVVFSRISKEDRPNWIVPFSVEKDVAIQSVKEKLQNGFFVSKQFKDVPPECVRGIYIPYFTYDGVITDTQHHQYFFADHTRVYDGYAEFENLLVECCSAINDRYSALLEPYDLHAAVDFDTSYLMGFYSNVQDIDPSKGQRVADLKARTLFHSMMRTQSPKSPFKKISSTPKIEMHKTGYILLPAWFITLNPDGKPYTFLVNGQTGKVVGTAPWNKALVTVSGIVLSASAVALILLLYKVTSYAILSNITIDVAVEASRNNLLQLLASILTNFTAIFLIYSLGQFKHLLDKMNRAGSIVKFIFSKKRQGGM